MVQDMFLIGTPGKTHGGLNPWTPGGWIAPVFNFCGFLLFIPYFIIFHHIPSYFIIFHHISSYSIIFHHIPSYSIIIHRISSYFIIFHLIMHYFCWFEIKMISQTQLLNSIFPYLRPSSSTPRTSGKAMRKRRCCSCSASKVWKSTEVWWNKCPLGGSRPRAWSVFMRTCVFWTLLDVWMSGWEGKWPKKEMEGQPCMTLFGQFLDHW